VNKIKLAVGVVCLVSLVSFIAFGVTKSLRFDAQCKAAGGVTASSNVCVRPDAVIPLK
jgi:uncharacterized membrane protein YjgN (DUF898 family)